MRVRKTRQKQLIEDELNRFLTFFNAEELFNQVAKTNKNIGIATIYRYLNNLASEGKIHSYTCNRRTIYSMNEKSHCHFICEKCGKIAHIQIKKLDFLQKEIKGSICHFQIDITGLCEKCKKE